MFIVYSNYNLSMGRVIFTLLLLTGFAVFGSNADYLRAKQKIELIEAWKARPGSVISFPPKQVAAYAAGEVANHRLRGVRDVRVALGKDTIHWSALMDFSQIPQLKSLSSNWLLGGLLKGETPVAMTLKLLSGQGQATIEVKRVVISRTTFEGHTLDFLVKMLVLTAFPGAKIGEPFKLGYNMERIWVRPSGITVKISD